MTFLLKSAAAFLCLSIFTGSSNLQNQDSPIPKPAAPKIQVAILLDVSNSMDGLIEQAKAQLWNMVNVMGQAKCDGVAPQIEIALYEYGRPANGVKSGYVRQISPFTKDLDGLSSKLFSLKTSGGEEYCGQVINTAINELAWDVAKENYKVIFIAGNEDFLQGGVQYTQACNQAKSKGVLVNTIYCGDKMTGIREHWNLGGECGEGSYTNINQDAKDDNIATPYDNTLVTLNTQLNYTYIYYGTSGKEYSSRQETVDAQNFSAGKSAGMKRIAVKGKKSVYDNSSWDLVDAYNKDKQVLREVETKSLPDSLKNKSKEEIERLIKVKNDQRTAIQKEIASLSIKRENYIVSERAKKSGATVQTLESETEKLIRVQAKKYKMVIE